MINKLQDIADSSYQVSTVTKHPLQLSIFTYLEIPKEIFYVIEDKPWSHNLLISTWWKINIYLRLDLYVATYLVIEISFRTKNNAHQ